MEKIGTKWSNDRFVRKIRPMLDKIISGTKCDRDKLIFFLQKERVNKIELGRGICNRDLMGLENDKKEAQLCRSSLPSSSIEIPPPP